jgi:hypothetical protein
MPSALFALGIFRIEYSSFYAQTSLECDSPIYTSQVAGISDECHHTMVID